MRQISPVNSNFPISHPLDRGESRVRSQRPSPVVCLVINGWGLAAPSKSNAFSLADTPNINRLISEYRAFSLKASGEAIGLEPNQPSNMSVGYTCLNAGSLSYSNLPRVDQSIADGSFFEKKVLQKIAASLRKSGGRLHLIGKISTHKKYSSLSHLETFLNWDKKSSFSQVFIHGLLNDQTSSTPARQPSARSSREDVISALKQVDNIIASNSSKNHSAQNGNPTHDGSSISWGSLCGTSFAMDRSGNWSKTQMLFDLLISQNTPNSHSDFSPNWESYLQNYSSSNNLPPARLSSSANLRPKDVVIFFNHRGDGLRQLARSLASKNFDKFPRPEFLKKVSFATLTYYDRDLPVAPIFPLTKPHDGLVQLVSQKFLRQLRLGDSGNFFHLTSGLNNSLNPLSGEQDFSISDPDEWLKIFLRSIMDEKYDFIFAGFSHIDLAADENSTDKLIKSIEKFDSILGILAENILNKKGILLIISDHGNAEEFIDLQTGSIKRGNTLNPVPFILIGPDWHRAPRKSSKTAPDLSLLNSSGSLVDFAPTVLKILQIRKPRYMEGRALI